MLQQKEEESRELDAGGSNERNYFDSPVVMNTSGRSTPVCSMCGKVISLKSSKTDEYGLVVHEQCYAAMSWLRGE
jgi:hypothetical protein